MRSSPAPAMVLAAAMTPIGAGGAVMVVGEDGCADVDAEVWCKQSVAQEAQASLASSISSRSRARAQQQQLPLAACAARLRLG